MEEILRQLLGQVIYPIICRGLGYIPGGAGFLPSTVCLFHFPSTYLTWICLFGASLKKSSPKWFSSKWREKFRRKFHKK